MRRPCWCTKQWQNVAQVLHNNRIKFPKDFFSLLSCTRTWPLWCHVKTANRRILGNILTVYRYKKRQMLAVTTLSFVHFCNHQATSRLSNSWKLKNISDTVGCCLVSHFSVLTIFWCHLWSVTEQVHGNKESSEPWSSQFWTQFKQLTSRGHGFKPRWSPDFFRLLFAIA